MSMSTARCQGFRMLLDKSVRNIWIQTDIYSGPFFKIALPEEYRWSSVHAHLGKACDPLITPHCTYLALGVTTEERAIAYGKWLHSGIDTAELSTIRRCIAQERVLGCPRFQGMVEKALGGPVECRNRGRPWSQEV